jgi:hypothetical protein
MNLLDTEKLRKFIFLLQYGYLISEKGESYIDELYRKRQDSQHEITKIFYRDYKSIRTELFEHLKNNNPEIDDLTLFNKTQKILDRFIFICFCEDVNLLPHQTSTKLLALAKESFVKSDTKLWDQARGLFRSINEGSESHKINRYNGGLFADDEILENLIIHDDVLTKLINLSEYDFDTDLNVNILGHIFEQSISDIEEIKAEIKDETHDSKNGKRKLDGIYYTPEYITGFIVKEAIGSWLQDRQKEFGRDNLPELTEKDIASIKRKRDGSLNYNSKIREHLLYWENYRNSLMGIKVLDPACGSGAFLVKAFDFLIEEGERVNDEIAKLNLGQYATDDLNELILKNNLYGVDINKESVEITKLSLWLKTARKGQELTSLDNNILCGNSLVDDPETAGEDAFKWEERFSGIMKSGGFDVVIGNPPYTNSPVGTKSFILKKYKMGSSETAICFLKRGKDLLNENGYLGFIIPKSYSYATNYNKIRGYTLKPLIKFVDCGKVWNEVKLEQAIIILNNKVSTDFYHSLKLENQDYIYLGKIRKDVVDTFHFILNGVAPAEINLAIKIIEKSKNLNNFATNKRGDMLQSSLIETGNIKVIGGADIQRYGIYTHKGYLKDKSVVSPGGFIGKNVVLVQNIIAHVLYPKDHVKITACIPENNDYVILDTINQLKVKNQVSNIFIWTLLNSKLINWYAYRFIFAKAIRTMHFDNSVTRRIPVRLPTNQAPIIEKANFMLDLNKELYSVKTGFLDFLKEKFGIDKFSKKLRDWPLLDFGDFLNELEKNKIRLELPEQNSWMDFFNNKKLFASGLQEKIDFTDKEINLMVYELYGLSKNEIKIIEGNEL